MDFIAVGNTGPVNITLWGGEEAKALESMALRFSQNVESSSSTRPIVFLDIVRPVSMVANKWNGQIVTPMQILQSVRPRKGLPGAKVSFVQAPSSPFLTNATLRCPHQWRRVASTFSNAQTLPFGCPLKVRFAT